MPDFGQLPTVSMGLGPLITICQPRGAGWNVIKVLWGSGWDALLAKDCVA